MKKTLLTVALVSAGLAFIPAAFAQDAQPATGNYQSMQPVGSGNWFVDLSAGRTDGYSKNSDFGSGFSNGSGSLFSNKNGRRTGYGVLGGYRWKVGPDLGLGLEAGYTDLGNYKLSNIGDNNGSVNQSSRENALRGWLVGANGRINLLPQWYISAHGGYFHANNDGGAYNDTVSQDLFHGGDRGGFYGGVGTGWDVNQHFGIGVKYDYYHVSAGNIHDTASNSDFNVRRSTGIVSVDAEYRF
jgi:outer membrane immunogenic protein